MWIIHACYNIVTSAYSLPLPCNCLPSILIIPPRLPGTINETHELTLCNLKDRHHCLFTQLFRSAPFEIKQVGDWDECSRRTAPGTLAKPRAVVLLAKVLHLAADTTLCVVMLCRWPPTQTHNFFSTLFLSFHIFSYSSSLPRSKLGVGVTKAVQGTSKPSGLIKFDVKIGDEKL